MHRALFLDNATKPSTQAGDTGEQEWWEQNVLVSYTPGLQ